MMHNLDRVILIGLGLFLTMLVGAATGHTFASVALAVGSYTLGVVVGLVILRVRR